LMTKPGWSPHRTELSPATEMLVTTCPYTPPHLTQVIQHQSSGRHGTAHIWTGLKGPRSDLVAPRLRPNLTQHRIDLAPVVTLPPARDALVQSPCPPVVAVGTIVRTRWNDSRIMVEEVPITWLVDKLVYLAPWSARTRAQRAVLLRLRAIRCTAIDHPDSLPCLDPARGLVTNPPAREQISSKHSGRMASLRRS
jgi:hypothetical protein